MKLLPDSYEIVTYDSGCDKCHGDEAFIGMVAEPHGVVLTFCEKCAGFSKQELIKAQLDSKPERVDNDRIDHDDYIDWQNYQDSFDDFTQANKDEPWGEVKSVRFNDRMGNPTIRYDYQSRTHMTNYGPELSVRAWKHGESVKNAMHSTEAACPETQISWMLSRGY